MNQSILVAYSNLDSGGVTASRDAIIARMPQIAKHFGAIASPLVGDTAHDADKLKAYIDRYATACRWYGLKLQLGVDLANCASWVDGNRDAWDLRVLGTDRYWEYVHDLCLRMAKLTGGGACWWDCEFALPQRAADLMGSDAAFVDAVVDGAICCVERLEGEGVRTLAYDLLCCPWAAGYARIEKQISDQATPVFKKGVRLMLATPFSPVTTDSTVRIAEYRALGYDVLPGIMADTQGSPAFPGFTWPAALAWTMRNGENWRYVGNAPRLDIWLNESDANPDVIVTATPLSGGGAPGTAGIRPESVTQD